MKLKLYTDGGARGNPGPAGIGFVILDGEKLVEEHGKYIGKATNNQAEYRALVVGLEHVKDLGADEVEIFMDSELIVKQIKGEYKVKNQDLAVFYLKVYNLLVGFKKYTIAHIRREKNTLADAQVNKAIDSHTKQNSKF